MGKADTTVDEENGKTRQRQEPSEDFATALCQVDEREAAEQELQDDNVDGATLLVNLGQELGSHACIAVSIISRVIIAWEKLTIGGKSLDCACRTVCARVGNAHDGDEDDGVHNRRQNLDTRELDGDNER